MNPLQIPYTNAIVRDDQRRARPAGEWLFRGMIPGRDLCRSTPERACRKAQGGDGHADRAGSETLPGGEMGLAFADLLGSK